MIKGKFPPSKVLIALLSFLTTIVLMVGFVVLMILNPTSARSSEH